MTSNYHYSQSSWFVINAAVVAYSCTVFLLLASGPSSWRFAHKSYYIYDVMTSMLWLAQVFLIGMTYGFQGWKRIIEIVLAFYFTIQSVLVLLKKHHGKDPSEHMEWEVVLNIFAYAYEIVLENCRKQTDSKGYSPLADLDKADNQKQQGLAVEHFTTD